jgi:NCAIR mutase (PurE)-related protein
VDLDALRQLLTSVATGDVSVGDATSALRRLPYADLGFARVDHHRPLRQGMPEAIYGPGKTPEQCVAIVAELLAHDGGPVVLTRATEVQRDAVLASCPEGKAHGTTVVWRPNPSPRAEHIVIAAAGTADGPVAEECATVLVAHGFEPERLDDVGVAGLHRLLAHADDLATSDVVVVVAGMEGAMASVVGGLTPAPVVAVPTSAGYGTSLGGVTALLSMLSSCAQGVTVVGIDNGFGAACAVTRICSQRAGRA